ncbi:hypothetical protein ACU4GD_03600, partial [Cupriavidus basilensis]
MEGRYLADMVHSGRQAGVSRYRDRSGEGTRFMLNAGDLAAGEVAAAAGSPTLVRAGCRAGSRARYRRYPATGGHPIAVIASAPRDLVLHESLKYLVLLPLTAGFAALAVLHCIRAARRAAPSPRSCSAGCAAV